MGTWFHDLGLFIFAVLAHWQALATGGVVTAVIGIYERKNNRQVSWQSYTFIIFAFAAYSLFASWQDEHRNTSQVEQDKMVYASQWSGCAADLKAVQSALHDKESLADSLSKAFASTQGPQAQQAANIASCINNLAKMNPVIREQITVVDVPFGQTDLKGKLDPQHPLILRYISELFVLTNEPQAKFHGSLRCESAFDIVDFPKIPISANGVMTTSNPPTRISDSEYEIRVDQTSTEWNQSHPAYMRVLAKSQQLGRCTFVPMQ